MLWDKEADRPTEHKRWESKRTVIDHDRDGALGRDFRPKRLECRPVAGEDTRKVATDDNNGVVRPCRGSLFAELDCLARRAGASAGNDGYRHQPSLVESLSTGLDEGDTFTVGNMMGFAHGTREEGPDASFGKAQDVGGERRHICPESQSYVSNSILSAYKIRAESSPISSVSGRKNVGMGAQIPAVSGRETLETPLDPLMCGSLEPFGE